jgi:RNA polymerase sigma-70 factor (ECF subfamily)
MKLFKASGAQDTMALVGRIQAGDPDAETELVERYRRGLLTFIRYNGGHSATEDLSQEVFYLVLEKIRRKELREPEKLSEFICGVARNLARRHAKTSKPMVELDPEWEETMTDPAPGPYEQLLQKEEIESVRRVLDQLPHKRDREVLRRFYCDKEDKERICADLKLSSTQFNKVISRARERFQARYQKK